MAALDFGFAVGDLYGRDGLVRLDGVFFAWLSARDEAVAARLKAARANPEAVSKKEESELLIALGPECEAFIAKLNEDGKKVVTEVSPLEKFFEAEAYHHHYFLNNPDKAYCQLVINPKLEKVRKRFSQLMNE